MQSLKIALRAFLIGIVVLVLILLVVNTLLVWWTGNRLETRLARIRAAGEPVVMTDLSSSAVPAEDNAVTFLLRARKGLQGLNGEVRPRLEALGDFHIAHPSEQQLRIIEDGLAAYPDVIPLLERASSCPEYDLKLNYSLSEMQLVDAIGPHVADARAAMSVLEMKAALALSQGDREQARECSLIQFRLCRRLGQLPFLVGNVVSLACRDYAIEVAAQVLYSGPISPESRQSLEDELARQDLLGSFREALKSERATMRDEVRGSDNWLTSAYGNYQEAVYLDAIDRAIAATGRNPWAFRGSFDDCSRTGQLGLAIPSFEASYDKCLSVEAAIRCLRLLNALQQRKTIDDGTVPALSTLGLPPQVILDPFTGKPLTVIRLPEGWLIYSYGRDGDDDGGNFTNQGLNDVGIGPQGTSQGQIKEKTGP